MDALTLTPSNIQTPLCSVGGVVVYADPETGMLVPTGSSQAETRAWIMELTNAALAQVGANGKEFEVKHTLLDGVYMRELFIPKGSLLIGKVHKMACMNIVSRGDISVLTEFGSARIREGYSGVSPAGIQKVGYAHEDTVFINVFRTDETDLDKIENAIAFSTYEEAGFLPPREGEMLCR